MCANGQLWDKAEPGSSKTYDDLIRGWDRWNAKHCHDTHSDIIDSDDYPHVSFFNKFINPPALRRLLVNMLNPDPAKRTTMADVANNRWFKNVECCQIDGYDDPSVVIDASKASSCSNRMTKVVLHNHLPPVKHHGHALVRLPGSTEMK
jgi:serine/threonine protein kinase